MYENITEYVYKAVYNNTPSSFYSDSSIKEENIINALNNLKKDLKANIPQFVGNITFIKANYVFKIENILLKLIYQKIFD